MLTLQHMGLQSYFKACLQKQPGPGSFWNRSKASHLHASSFVAWNSGEAQNLQGLHAKQQGPDSSWNISKGEEQNPHLRVAHLVLTSRTRALEGAWGPTALGRRIHLKRAYHKFHARDNTDTCVMATSLHHSWAA